jgi:hypothetical protein
MCSMLGSIPLALSCLCHLVMRSLDIASQKMQMVGQGPRRMKKRAPTQFSPSRPFSSPLMATSGLDWTATYLLVAVEVIIRRPPRYHNNTSKLPKTSTIPLLRRHPILSHLAPLSLLRHHRWYHILIHIRYVLMRHLLFMVMERAAEFLATKICKRPLLSLLPHLMKHAKMWRFAG